MPAPGARSAPATEAAPPIMISCRLEISNLPSSGQFSSALAMVGTSDMAVAVSSWIRRSTCGGSKRRTITCLMPIMVAACGRPQPLAWNSGMVCSSTPCRRGHERGRPRERVQVERAVRQHHALGRAGAAAGVEQLGDGVFVEGEDVGPLDAAARRAALRRSPRPIVDRTRCDAGAGLAQLFDQRREIGFVNQHARLRRGSGWRSARRA